MQTLQQIQCSMEHMETAIPHWIELNEAAAVLLSARCPCASSSNTFTQTNIQKWPDFYFCIFLFIYIYLIYYGKKREVKNEYCYLSERLKCSEGTEEGVVGGGGLF